MFALEIAESIKKNSKDKIMGRIMMIIKMDNINEAFIYQKITKQI